MYKNKKKPLLVYVLWILIGFQSLLGLAGGAIMILDPTGKTLSIPGIFLMGTPFENYLVPGLFLLFFLGLFPALSLMGLMEAKWRWPQVLNLYQHIHWGWTFSLYVAIISILWMDIQVFFIGYWHVIQTFNALMGVLILIVTLLPVVLNYYRISGTEAADLPQ